MEFHSAVSLFSVKKIMNSKETEEQIDNMIEILERNVSHPEVRDLIFWNEENL